MNLTLLNSLLVISAVCYFYYTLNYALKFRNNLVFKGGIYVFHQIMFWLIPFMWIWLIKNMLTSPKGSHEIEKKSEPIPFSGSSEP
jgi:hypothetical protein